MKLAGCAFFFLLATLAGQSCFAQSNYPRGITMFWVDSTKGQSGDFIKKLQSTVNGVVLLKGKVKWVSELEWTINADDQESIQRHFMRYGPYAVEFCLNHDTNKNGVVRNLSIIIIDIKSGTRNMLYSQNLYFCDIAGAISTVLDHHIRTIDAGWKQPLYVYDNFEKNICNNYTVCFNSFFNNHYLIDKYYVQRRPKIEGEGQIIFKNSNASKKFSGFVFVNHDLQKVQLSINDCDANMTNEIENFCQKVTKNEK
jgi:hypothetical protein